MRRRKTALPMMMAELGFNAMEVIARRTAMMAAGTCSPAEYRRMVREKMAAMASSARLLAGGRSGASLLAPWHSRAKKNAVRLRRK
jgi:hypothetical protein